MRDLITTWPRSQELSSKEGFEDHCTLLNDLETIITLGYNAYSVDEEWYNKNFPEYIQDCKTWKIK